MPQRVCRTAPLKSTTTSLAEGGRFVVTTTPAGQRTQIWVGRPGPLITCTVLSSDQ